MGESTVDASNHKDKMGETASNPVLEVSVSFGRFENDTLSWEKWSSFSPNKYLEEVERCATPGSVAQKAAYFEAHYKKIAARKAELLDQEKHMDDDTCRSNDQTCGDLIVDNCRTKSESDLSDCQSSAEVVNHETSMSNDVSETLVNEPNKDAAIAIECLSTSIEGVESILDEPTLDKSEEAVHEVKNTSMGMQDVKKLQPKDMENTSNDKEENVKLDRSKESYKFTLVNKERNITRTKKKAAPPVVKASPIAKASPRAKTSPMAKASPVANASSKAKASPVANASSKAKASPLTKASPAKASPVVKAPQISAPRVSKPTAASTPISSSRSSARIGNSSSLLRTKNPAAGESKKLAPKSLHMSLSLGPSRSDPAPLTTTRKSFIMENMGDKDIVKRAFKTFQNSYNQLKFAGEDRSPAPKQVPATETEPRVPVLMTPQKENGGSFKAGVVEKKHGKAAPSSLAMKSDDRAEKRREFSKKLEEKKSNAREAERTRLQTKSKEDKETEMKKVRQSHNFKATMMSRVNRGQRISKGSLDTGDSKNEIRP